MPRLLPVILLALRGGEALRPTAHPAGISAPPGEQNFWKWVQHYTIQAQQRGARVLAKGGQDVASLLETEHSRAKSLREWYAEVTGAPIEAINYWNDPRIHNFGNTGLGGWVHSFVAPLATYLIDQIPYSGIDARALVHATIPPSAQVTDLCSGVAFSSAPWGNTLAVDVSIPMLTVAKFRNPWLKVDLGNAETYGEPDSCDVVTLMYGFHEMPQDARRRILRNAMRIARRHIVIVDICPSLVPTPMMLSGEPYLFDYLENIDNDMRVTADWSGWKLHRDVVVPGHVVMWRLDCPEEPPLLEPFDPEA